LELKESHFRNPERERFCTTRRQRRYLIVLLRAIAVEKNRCHHAHLSDRSHFAREEKTLLVFPLRAARQTLFWKRRIVLFFGKGSALSLGRYSANPSVSAKQTLEFDCRIHQEKKRLQASLKNGAQSG
jgi:hypothetical protein